MMPGGGNSSLSTASGNYAGLQSANMISSMQQQSSSSSTKYTSYKVQSNSYSSGGSRIDSYDSSANQKYDSSQSANQNSAERPGSRLKANIDELDTLLSDLNNAQHHNTRSHETSSEDYGDHSSHLQVSDTQLLVSGG